VVYLTGELTVKYAETVAELGGVPVLVDLNQQHIDYISDKIKENITLMLLV